MINSKNVNPGRAIKTMLAMIVGNQALRAKKQDTAMLSFYLEGEPGVGKSAIGKAIANKLGYYMEDIRANQMSPDDAGGLRMPNPESKTTDWYAPQWMPDEDGTVVKEGKEYKGTVLFFDELASADDRVRKPLFGVFLDRVMNGRKLPDNCIVLAAGNESDTGTMVFELDNATRTRFITLRIIADFDSWLRDFAPMANISPTTVAFLKQNIGLFCMTSEALDKNLDLYGNPRSWEHVSISEQSIMPDKESRQNEENRDILEDLISGKVGTGIATQYMAVFDIISKMDTLYDLIQEMEKGNIEKLEKMFPKNISQLYALTYSMMAYVTDIESGQQVYKIMRHFPKKSKIAFEEMKPAIMEVTFKKLIDLGYKSADLKFFKEDNKSMAEELITGPLIKIDL